MAETNVPDNHASLLLRTYEVQLADGSPKFLLCEILVDCASCGSSTIQLHGHHLTALRDCIDKALANHPGLCGQGARETGRTQWSASVDPAKVRNN